jgi:isoleucyl-tRNA synthetase
MILLDAFAYPELAQEGLAREVLNRIQRLRKRACLVPTDDVRLTYSVLPPTAVDGTDGASQDERAANTEVSRLEAERQVEEMFAQQRATFGKAVSHGVAKAKADAKGEKVIAEEEAEVKDVRLLLKLLEV